MEYIKRIHAVYLSPTGNTAEVVNKTAKSIASRTGALFVSHDLTLPPARTTALEFPGNELVVCGVPTYAGRVPNKFLPFIQELIKGNGTPVIPIVTFGNRSFDSSLLELANTLEENGFRPLAAAAVCCVHAFAGIGKGRPNKNDAADIKDFAARIASFILDDESVIPGSIDLGEPIEVQPYYIPLKEDGTPAKFLKAKPETDTCKCSHCGICAEQCPMGSISFEDPTDVPGICIKCQACVKYCPQGAKRFTDKDFLSHKAMLERDHSRPAKNRFFYWDRH